jgi:hypothetical protein
MVVRVAARFPRVAGDDRCRVRMVPWLANRFGWWLAPKSPRVLAVRWLGVAMMMAPYASMILVFWRFY